MARHLDDRKRQKILDAAVRVFGTQGYGVSSVKEIAVEAGVSPGTVYTYFKGKSDLFDQTVDASWNVFHEKLHQILSEKASLPEKLSAVARYGLGLLEQVHPLVRGMYSESIKKDLMTEHINRLCDDLTEHLLAHVKEPVRGRSPSLSERKLTLRIIISGIIFTVAITTKNDLTGTIDEIQNKLVAPYVRRLKGGDM